MDLARVTGQNRHDLLIQLRHDRRKFTPASPAALELMTVYFMVHGR
jgi:hypothetical protein